MPSYCLDARGQFSNARMAERKFSRGLRKPGMAAQLRESVSQVVRETAVQVTQQGFNMCPQLIYLSSEQAPKG